MRNQQRLAAREASRSEESDPHREFRVLGPEEEFVDDEQLLLRLTGLWEDSSRQLQHLSRGEGFLYLHCLQPSALLEDAKPLSVEEQRFVASSTERQRAIVRAGYPRLQRAGERLAEAGESFCDLTDVFAGVQETVFNDACHLNQRGNDLLAERIAGEVLARWGNGGAKGSQAD